MLNVIFLIVLSTWSFFGIAVLLNMNSKDIKSSLRLVIVLGPIIVAFAFAIGCFLVMVEKTKYWINNS
jgi:hypothetical protein